ncbi:MAG: YetF domain-containing protein [Leeuwenhoekiella sp.]
MFEKYFYKDISEIPYMVLGAIVIYIIMVLYTRIFGLKSFSKMTGFDFVNTVAIGNILAMSVATSNPTWLTGILLIGLLYFMNYMIAVLRNKSENLRQILDNSPLLLMENGKIIHKNMKAAKVTEDELIGKLREANVIVLSQVKAVVLETTGDVSVLHSDKDIELESYLLKDVQR